MNLNLLFSLVSEKEMHQTAEGKQSHQIDTNKERERERLVSDLRL